MESISSSATYQHDARYSGYQQQDYNASQYGPPADYNAQTTDYSQTAPYDNRAYGGYGEFIETFIFFYMIFIVDFCLTISKPEKIQINLNCDKVEKKTNEIELRKIT